MKTFQGRVAVVTGAASGIGRGMAESFAAAGMRVVLSDVDAPALEAAAAALRSGGAEVHAVPADVSKPEEVEALAREAAGRFGAVHVLCNNAGVFAGGETSWTRPLEEWQWILGINLMGVVHGIRSFLPRMIEQDSEAHIVNTASLGGLVTGGSVLYGATKFAVVGLSENLREELQARGLKPRVSVLCPGFVDTGIVENSRRRRPAAFDEAAPRPSAEEERRLAGLRQAAAEALRRSIGPRAVGEQVLAAIRAERFYILTHPEWNAAIRRRTKEILKRPGLGGLFG
ncbi:MAG TPA: SDR family NAD(P)-dependent oxidoreductase [Opitutaceae bacterium]|nr:SDR family NAD(P)-dependent oxidoreductase [Opitutaceae bacterium]